MSLPTCRVRLRVLVCLSPAHAHPPFAPLPCAGDHCLGRGQAGQSSPLFSTLERVLGFKDMRFPPPKKTVFSGEGTLTARLLPEGLSFSAAMP